MFTPQLLPYIRGNDCLQTRVRRPRKLMPNFALYCDWILWDQQHLYVDLPRQPQTVYVRSQIVVLTHFVESVLPRIAAPFVLITSSHDGLMPIGFQKQFNFDWSRIVNNKYLRAWYTENRDLVHDKIHPLPLGIPHPDLPSWIQGDSSPAIWTDSFFKSSVRLQKSPREMKIFGCWYPRVDHSSGSCPADDNERKLAYACLIDRADLFDWHAPGLSRTDFLAQMGSYQFVLCPHGGGLDPNPKCWEALLMKAIPIVKRNTMTSALEHLPVAFVDDWSEINRQRLDQWHAELHPQLQNPELPYLMSNDYFFKKILRHLETQRQP